MFAPNAKWASTVLVLWAAFALGPSAGVAAQDGRTDQKVSVYEIEAVAARCPRNLRADLLLRLADLPSVSGNTRRKTWIESAFALAADVVPAVPTTPVPIGFTDSVPAMSAISSRRMLVDSLSLRLRAVRQMLPLSTAVALKMFQAISPPRPGRGTCQDLSVPDLAGYYDTATQVADSAFDAADPRKEQFLLDVMLPLSSASQVIPTLRLLADTNVPSSTRQSLARRFAEALRNLESDDRAFTIAFFEEESGNHLRVLLQQAQADRVVSTPLLEAFKTFYVRHLAAPRCEDTAQAPQLRIRQDRAIKVFNDIAAMYQSPGVRMGSVLPGRYQPAARARDLVLASKEYRELLRRVGKLGTKDTEDERSAVSAVSNWREAAGIDEQGFLILKSQLLVALFQKVRDPAAFKLLCDGMASFFVHSSEQQSQAPVVWLFYFSKCLQEARNSGGDRGAMLIRLLETADSPVVRAYAGLDAQLWGSV